RACSRKRREEILHPRARQGAAKLLQERSRRFALAVEYCLVKKAFGIAGNGSHENVKTAQTFVLKAISLLRQTGMGRTAKHQGESIVGWRRRQVFALVQLKAYRIGSVALNVEPCMQLCGEGFPVDLSKWIGHAEEHL